MDASKPRVAVAVDPTSFAHVDGGTREIGGTKGRWSILFVYRRRHCPRCKRYLNKLNAALADWTAKMDVIVVSADTQEKAIAHYERVKRFESSFTNDRAIALADEGLETPFAAAELSLRAQ